MTYNNESKSIGEWIVILVVGAILVTPCVILEGFVVSTLWRWFLVPVTSLPAIGIAQATGLGVLANLMISNPWFPDEDTKPTRMFYILVGRPLLILAIGWVALQFVH